MKKLFKNPGFYVASWFAIVSIVALLVSSCGVHYVQCDAYGSLDYKKPSKRGTGVTFEVMTEERASFLAEQNK